MTQLGEAVRTWNEVFFLGEAEFFVMKFGKSFKALLHSGKVLLHFYAFAV